MDGFSNLSGLPAMSTQIDPALVDPNPFRFQALCLGPLPATTRGDAAVGPQHPMPGQVAVGGQVAQHPGHQAGAAGQPGESGHVAIAGHPAARNGRQDQANTVLRAGFGDGGGRLPCYTGASGHLESTLRFLFLLFVIMPVMELYILIRVGQWLGAWPTIGLVFLTAAVGISLLRQQGFATLRTVQARLDRGEVPAREMVEGVVLLVGGAMFLAPGFVTDTFGFACLLPPTRRRIATFLMTRATWQVRASVRFGAGPSARSQSFEAGNQTRSGGRIIEGEYERDDDPRP